MKGFTVKINLCEDDMDDIKRLNALTKEIAPDMFGNDTLEDTIGFVARSGFTKELQSLLEQYKEKGENT